MGGAVTRQQRDLIKQFRNVTGSDDKEAKDFLKNVDWVLDEAVDDYFASGRDAKGNMGAAGLQAAFAKYVDAEEGRIMADGVIAFLGDLGVDPSDAVTLVIACHMGAETVGEFTQEEFMRGMRSMGAGSVEALKGKLGALRGSLGDPERLREVYTFAYGFTCPRGQKCLQLEESCALWELLLGGRYPLLDKWLSFVRAHHGRAISRDTWTQFLEFTRSVKPDLSNYDADGGAWPYLIDEFVEHARKGE